MRLPPPLVRHVLAHHRVGQLSAIQAAQELNLSRARFYKLYSQYLQACAKGKAQVWSPGISGGDHRPSWPAEVIALLTKLLSSKPPSTYSAAASELYRRLQFKTDRASVRRWAIENKLAPDTASTGRFSLLTLSGIYAFRLCRRIRRPRWLKPRRDRSASFSSLQRSNRRPVEFSPSATAQFGAGLAFVP